MTGRPTNHSRLFGKEKMKLSPPRMQIYYHEEPALEFGSGRLHVDPKSGITRFGPRSIDQKNRHPSTVKVGFIGTGKTIAATEHWLKSCALGVSGGEFHQDFPGFNTDRGYFAGLDFSEAWQEQITQHELERICCIKRSRDRFDACVELIADKMRILSQKENSPNYVILALPDELVKKCETVDYVDKNLGRVHRDLRIVIKSHAMVHHLPTQIVRERIVSSDEKSKDIDHPSRIAWDLFSGLYYKAGGIPWSPTELRAGTCYIGVSFHRPIGSRQGNYFTSIAQAFDEHGDGLVLRGQDFSWDEKKDGPSPHLSADLASELVEKVLERYRKEIHQNPVRVVIHKTSQYWPDEREGFRNGIRSVNYYDLVSVYPTSQIRLLRDARYPVLRGTRFSLGDMHLLYTTGYLPALETYPHGHIPSPLRVFDHIGDSDIAAVLDEVLVLSKMNWNSSAFCGLLPITVRFSRLVGNIIKEVGPDREPMPQYKYYI